MSNKTGNNINVKFCLVLLAGFFVFTSTAKADTWTPPKAVDPSMEVMKTKGCVADGLLSGYGGQTKKEIEMINRSGCQYLHRSIETWLDPPDFKKIRQYKKLITKPDMIYGMFLAEAISTKSELYYPAEDRKFNFKKMCREGSKNYWGEHTCKPTLTSEEYRKYLRYITEQAMDMGVQSFMFGQVFYQDNLENPQIADVIKQMREYADFVGIKIVVGAQTNDITDETYLRNFDFIEGGVGLSRKGTIENGACFSRWYKKPGDWCWALLWHKKYASKANNVLLHLDWSGRHGDDMSTFAQMDRGKRAQTLTRLHKYFNDKGDGFLLPVLAVLPKNNNSCYGPKHGFYSASSEFSCADEKAINKVLK